MTVSGTGDDSTSTGLLDAVRAADPAAWERLVDLYGRLVLFWCRRAGLGESDRSDVVQEVFRTVYCRLETFRKERPEDSFRAWLRTVTRHKIIDHCRSEGRHTAADGGSEAVRQLQQFADPDSAESEAGDDPSAERMVLLSRALELVRGEFEPRTWQAFWQTAADGVPTHVVAEELGMSDVAIRKARSRVFRRLRDCFVDPDELDAMLD